MSGTKRRSRLGAGPTSLVVAVALVLVLSGCTLNSLWSWGYNLDGQLGTDTEFAGVVPAPDRQVGGTTWKTIDAGDDHSCGIVSNSTLRCWGSSDDGRLGTLSMPPAGYTAQVGAGLWRSVSAGGAHTCGIDVGSTLWCWGANDRGQVGNGSTGDVLEPVQVGVGSWRSVSAGGAHT